MCNRRPVQRLRKIIQRLKSFTRIRQRAKLWQHDQINRCALSKMIGYAFTNRGNMAVTIADADRIRYRDLATQQSQGVTFLHSYDLANPKPPFGEPSREGLP